MGPKLSIAVDRGSRVSLSEQINRSIEAAIIAGQLAAGARMPSWQDLASQLGVARGTVKAAYDRLIDAQLIVSAGPAGTYVTDHPPPRPDPAPVPSIEDPFELIGLAGPSNSPRLFQLGMPAKEVLSAKTWSKLSIRGARLAASQMAGYPDPRGEFVLRHQIAAYLAIGRSVVCQKEQIFITHGFGSALALAIRALALEGKTGWIENPGYSLSRRTLELCCIDGVPVPVDAEGLDVAHALSVAPGAGFAVVTPGQQAPLGVTMSLSRRHALLEWAKAADAYIIEDDYLGELQLDGRSAPSLASLDSEGRVIHVGTFSKTISPALRLGFVVVPPQLVSRFLHIAACIAPSSSIAGQLTIASFISEGHLLRHLRRARRLYTERRGQLRSWLAETHHDHAASAPIACGLSVLLPLPDGTPDMEIARQAKLFGMAPSPLSQWYSPATVPKSGLLLGVTNVTSQGLESKGAMLWQLIDQYANQ